MLSAASGLARDRESEPLKGTACVRLCKVDTRRGWAIFFPLPVKIHPISWRHMIPTRLSALVLACLLASAAHAQATYRVLATGKTSTMQKEMQEAGDAGFHFVAVMGGETAAGGNETVVLMEKIAEDTTKYSYRLLATTKTSTLEKELREAAGAGFEMVGQTVFESMTVGKESAAIVEKRSTDAAVRYEYRLVSTAKTSTLQKELQELADQGFRALGMTVGKTAMGGNEIVVIARRVAK